MQILISFKLLLLIRTLVFFADPVFFWTSGHRVNVTNNRSSFVWRLQTANYHIQLPITVDAWVPGFPKNENYLCLLLHFHYNYLWTDSSFNGRANPLCEIDIAWYIFVSYTICYFVFMTFTTLFFLCAALHFTVSTIEKWLPFNVITVIVRVRIVGGW